MSELLQAAKAVIDYEKDHSYNFANRVAALRAAVERAEREPKNGLDQLLERIRFLEQQIAERTNPWTG